MSIVPKGSVRFQVALAVLVTIALSWVLSTGLANYLNYLSIKSLRQTMLDQPDIYSRPIPEPRFGVMDFLLSRPPRPPRPPTGGPPPHPEMPGFRAPAGPPPPQDPRAAMPPRTFGQPEPMGPPPPTRLFSPLELRWVLLRLAVALALAVLAAVWLGRMFTGPLMELADGARKFRARYYSHRVPVRGINEFTDVAMAMNEMADEVSRHIHSLEEAAERRRQFLADIAHELRAPITTMRTMAGALQDGVADEPERKERAVSALVRTSERMLRLVQDVMQLAELDMDKLSIARSEVDVRNLVATALASREGEAANARIVLNPLQPAPPLVAAIDPDRIAQVLDNIIGNAISYAGAGASLTAVVEDGDPIRISITDTGAGIPANDLPHVLDAFYRVNAARTPSEGHIGLGLSIARRLVEAHGGQLLISSDEGKGTTATILIPKGL